MGHCLQYTSSAKSAIRSDQRQTWAPTLTRNCGSDDCALQCCPSQKKRRGNIVARRADRRNVCEVFQKHMFASGKTSQMGNTITSAMPSQCVLLLQGPFSMKLGKLCFRGVFIGLYFGRCTENISVFQHQTTISQHWLGAVREHIENTTHVLARLPVKTASSKPTETSVKSLFLSTLPNSQSLYCRGTRWTGIDQELQD